MTDDQLYDFWIRRDCIEAIRAGDMRAQFISAARALLAAQAPSALASDAWTGPLRDALCVTIDAALTQAANTKNQGL